MTTIKQKLFHFTFIAIIFCTSLATAQQISAQKANIKSGKKSTDYRTLAKDFYSEVVNQRKFNQLNKYIADNYVQHAVGLAPGRDGVAQFLTFITTAIPDLKTEVLHIALDNNKLIAVVKWSGTNKGTFGNYPATNKPVSFTVAEVFSLKNGKFSEHWSVADQTEMMITIGALQPVAVPKQTATQSIDDIVDPNARVELIANGYKHAEGSIWTPNGSLLFSDVTGNQMLMVANQKPQIYRDPSGYANGNAFDNQGNLYTAQHDRRITRTDKNGIVTTLAERFNGKRLNSPNDLVVHSNGSIYFTDPPFGLMGYGPAKGESELGFSGVYRLDKQGILTLLTKELKFPNGITFSPDEKTLYINDGFNSQIHAYPVNADGSLDVGHVFADLSIAGQEAFADGMKVDTEGRLYAGNLDGVWIFSSQGVLLGKIAVPQPVSNLAFGGAKGTTLYITAGTALYKIDLLSNVNKINGSH